MPNKQELIEAVANLGINMRDVRLSEEGYIASIHISFDPYTWFDLIKADGDWLPACCDEVSDIRDIFVDALKRNQEFSAEDIIRIGIFCKISHHKDEFKNVKDRNLGGPIKLNHMMEARVLKGEFHPVELITHVAETLKTFIDVEPPAKNPEKISDALFQVSDLINYIGTEHINVETAEVTKFHREAAMKYEIAKMGPFLKRFIDFVSEHATPLEGYALMKDGEVLQFNSGIAITETKDEAQEVIKCWEAFDVPTEGVEILKCRVSLDDGFVLL